MKNKKKLWLYGLIGIFVIFGLSFAFISINFKEKNTDELNINSLNSNDNINNDKYNVSKDKNESSKSIVKNVVENIADVISTDFKGNVESLLPTIDDFDIGYEVTSNEIKTIDDFSKEDRESVILNGFIDGWERKFEKGSATLYDIDNYEFVFFDISIYPKENILNTLNNVEKKVNSGNLTQIVTVDYEEYDNILNDWVIKQKEEELTYILGLLKDPKIGDKSILWSQQEKEAIFKTYTVTFIKNNVRVAVACFSSDSQKAIENCINWAKFVEKEI